MLISIAAACLVGRRQASPAAVLPMDSLRGLDSTNTTAGTDTRRAGAGPGVAQLAATESRPIWGYGDGPALAIGFLTRDSLPLWKVWDNFFKNTHLSKPVVHSQAHPKKKKAIRKQLKKWVYSHHGAMVPERETRWGDMRFSCNMTAAMFALVRTASTMIINGLTPKWIHFASERCAPIRPAYDVLRFLSTHEGVSHMEEDPFTAAGKQTIPDRIVPKEFKPLVMTSQWLTLWMEDGKALAADGHNIWNK